MPIRLIEVFVPQSHADRVVDILKEEKVHNTWSDSLADERALIRALIDTGQSEKLLDRIQKHLSSVPDVRILLLPVEAALPRPDEPVKPERSSSWVPRISREELYTDISELAKLDWVYVVMVVLSTIVAAIGLLRDSVAVIIGAMVIAPLLGPVVALYLATTLGDVKLGIRSLKTNGAGMLIALGLSIGYGLIFQVDPSSGEIASRTHVDLADIVLATASGIAGALAFTTGVSSSLIGVMVAVALLPPLVVFGMLIGSGNVPSAWGALLLLGTNLVCVSLSGVVTFFLQGVRPRTHLEAGKARRATAIAIGLWTFLLAVLVVLTLLARS